MGDPGNYMRLPMLITKVLFLLNCSFDGNSSISIGSLLNATCNFQFKFAQASCQVPVFNFKVLNLITHLCFKLSTESARN